MKLARWSVHSVVALALLGAVLGGGTSVGATTASDTATTACPTPTSSTPDICISEVSDAYTATTITLTMTVPQATNPTTDPNWANSGSVIKWALYTDGGTTSSYSASESVSSSAFTGSVTPSPSGTATCTTSSGVMTTFSTTANTYALSFPASCLGSPAPTSLSVQATWSYVDDGTTDTAALPAAGTAPCCSVTPDPATTTGSSTTTTSTTTTTTSTTTTTTLPSTGAGVTTTTTSVAAVVSSPSSTGNTGSGSSGLAVTGAGDDTPVLIVAGVALVAIGILGRRRFVGLARRAKRSRVQ